MGVFVGIYVGVVGIMWVFLAGWRRQLAAAEHRLIDARVQAKRVAPVIRHKAQTADFMLWQGQRLVGSVFDLVWRAVVRAGAAALVKVLGGRLYVRIWAVPLMRAVVRSWQNRTEVTRKRGEER